MDSRNRIIGTALKAFIERGYDGVSMKDIADGVSMKAASLYYHFQDKRTLFEACVTLFFERWYDWLSSMELETLDLYGVIRAICAMLGSDNRMIQELYGADSEIGQYQLLVDIVSVCPEAAARMKGPNGMFATLLSEKIRIAKANGDIRSDVSENAVYYLLGSLLEGSNIMCFTDREMDGALEGERIAEIIWNGIKTEKK